jgi:hypothetical protein
MQKSDFREWDLDKLDATFGLRQARTHPVLSAWLAMPYALDEFERKVLLGLQKTLLLGVDSWNEVELENKFISPLIVFADFDNEQFAYFLERELRGIVGNYDLGGRVDGLIASGFRSPHQPYFCLSEYKKQREPEGDPAAQALVAMLVAQELNGHQMPVYGSYIIGRDWYFMILEGQAYCISQDYSAAQDQIFDIYRILQGLKQIILKHISLNA